MASTTSNHGEPAVVTIAPESATIGVDDASPLGETTINTHEEEAERDDVMVDYPERAREGEDVGKPVQRSSSGAIMLSKEDVREIAAVIETLDVNVPQVAPNTSNRRSFSVGRRSTISQPTKPAPGGGDNNTRKDSAHDFISMHNNHIRLKDNRINPSHKDFDYQVFLKAVRDFFKKTYLELPQMEIAFKDVAVYGDAAGYREIETVGSKLISVIKPLIHIVDSIRHYHGTLFPKKLQVAKEILKPISGVMRPGQCTLVIGRPGSGCSTLLRLLANRRSTFKEVKGDIMFAGMTSSEVQEKFRSELVFSEEDDPHYPSLTVEETLDFALRCRIDNEGIRKGIIEVQLKLFGLTGCRHTLIGNEQLRGISGGEKKRVSLSEASCVVGSANIFDGCTKGLDAASAFDFIKGLRNLADFQGRTVIASCYQASDAMFDLFDQVIILQEGYCVYYGPAGAAVKHFESLGFQKHPRDTKAEFLTTAASSGKFTATELHEKYKESSEGQKNQKSAETALSNEHLKTLKENFMSSVSGKRNLLKGEGKVPTGPFGVSYFKQFTHLLRREAQIIIGNPTALIIRCVFCIVMALIVGSVYFQLPTNTSGAFTRGGVLFFSLLFNSFTAMSEIPSIMEGRPVLQKHIDFALYKPSIYFLTRMVFNCLMDIIQISCFSCILYFLAGLQVDVGKFFLFAYCVLSANQTFGLFIKAVANATETKESASQKAGTILISFVIYSGYIIPYPDMKPWFVWVHWINPLAYSFKSLLINEFSGLQFTCSGVSVVPAGPVVTPIGTFYNNSLYQTCTLAGATPGSPYVDGQSYITKAYNIDPSYFGWNLLINFGFWLVLIFVNCVIVEKVKHGRAGVSLKLFKGHSRRKIGDEAGQDNYNYSNVHSAAKATYKSESANKDATNTLTWTDICYTVPQPKQRGKTLSLLDNISGYAKPGTLTALMGSSGAGKTTLLDVVAKRKTIGQITGDICIGGKTQGKEFLRMTGYCEQMDVHNRDATVREALRFAAYLRQPKSVPIEEKNEYCEKIIDLLELRPIADALVGELTSGIGLSMEERKRLTIGIELVARPKILFLDEPTSGLDAQASTNIVRLMRNLAADGYALLVTIHQPSSLLFAQFDRLLLLGRGGRTIYFGDIGQDCQTLIGYFEKNGAAQCGPSANPAEYILACIGAGTAASSNTIDWPEKWNQSPEKAMEQKIIANLLKGAEVYYSEHEKELLEQQHQIIHDVPSFGMQTRLVIERMFIGYWRSPKYNVGRCVFQCIAALIIGFTFFQAASTPSGAQNRVFALFMTSVIGIVIINLVQPMFVTQRDYSIREVSSGTYKILATAISITTVEIPFAMIASTVFFLLFYWTVGLNTSWDNVLYFFMMLVLFQLWAVSFGQMVASMVPNLTIASAIVPLCTAVMSLFCGVTVPYNSMPDFYKNWLYWIDPYHYFIEGLIVNDLHNLALTCDDRSYVNVIPPPGQTCGSYLSIYMMRAPGYLANPTATDVCRYCLISVGDTFFTGLSWDYGNRWRNTAVLAGLWIFNRVLTLVFMGLFKVKR